MELAVQDSGIRDFIRRWANRALSFVDEPYIEDNGVWKKRWKDEEEDLFPDRKVKRKPADTQLRQELDDLFSKPTHSVVESTELVPAEAVDGPPQQEGSLGEILKRLDKDKEYMLQRKEQLEKLVARSHKAKANIEEHLAKEKEKLARLQEQKRRQAESEQSMARIEEQKRKQ